MSRADLFKAAADKAEKEKANKGNYNPTDYEDFPYVDLENNVPKVIRIIGDPENVRQTGFSPKKFLVSKIVDDKGNQFTCRWSDDRNWPLWKIFNKVMEYVWDKEAPNPQDASKKGAKVFKHSSTHPELFKRVRWNNKENNTMERGWNPSVSIMMNVIDRSDYDWHVENQSYKLISKKFSQKKDDPTIVFHEPGIPTTCYDLLLKSVVEEKGSWEDFDIAIIKEDDKPWYSVYSSMDKRKIQDRLTCEMNSDALTDDELSWKKYDFDTHPAFQITSNTKILNRLGDFIKKVDASFNTHYFEEIQKLSEAEKAKWESEKENEDSSSEAAEEKKEAPKRTRANPSSDVSKEDKFAVAKKAGWKGLDKMADGEKKLIKSIVLGKVPEQDYVVFVDDAGIEIDPKDDSLMIPCYECNLGAPESIHMCPRCGSEFD